MDSLIAERDEAEAEVEQLRAKVKKLERAIRKALGHHIPGELTPLTIRHILMDGLRD